ncbi:MAG: type II toxin-antitoxin system HigB family toxin [Candidatus Symbiothrix sp.]|jgi:mRNA interferase HigB|nr:type II toxin-antitoxin system HigB family toxin [Candidatus Symbiothrix sp.]
MKILNKELLDRFAKKHANSINAIDRWVKDFELNEFSNHNELKALFPNADYIKRNRYVFNIKGNDYRVVAIVLFTGNIATICFVGTHAEYDTIDCLTVLQ